MTGKILVGEKSVTEETRSLGVFFFEQAKKHGTKICQINADTGEKESFESVRQRTTRVAIEMRKRGISKNDIILFCSKNDLNNIIPFIAALYLGAKVASIDPTLSVRDSKYSINLVKPKYIFVEQDSVKLLEESIVGTGCNPQLVVIGESKKYPVLEEFLQKSSEEETFTPVTVDCHDTAIIYFSSGTTGLPKGICNSHYGLLLSAIGIIEMGCYKMDALLHFTSLYWISAAMLTLFSFLSGGYKVLSPKIDAEKFLKIVEEYKVSHCFMAPIFSYQLTNLENAEKYDTSSLYSVWLGGTPISEKQLLRTRKLLKHTHVTLAYGSTEASGCLAVFDVNKDKNIYPNKKTSSGKVARDLKIKVVDVDTRAILGPNQQGEICFKSPCIMTGYHNMDSSNVFDEDNFMKIGDIGYYDEDEYIYIVDRIKDMFKCRAWHVVPATLEALLQEHPAVLEAAVFGLPHEIDGYHPAACVVLKPNAKVTVEELQKFVSDRVAETQKLRGGIKVVDFIPKTTSGKLQRSKVKDFFINNALN